MIFKTVNENYSVQEEDDDYEPEERKKKKGKKRKARSEDKKGKKKKKKKKSDSGDVSIFFSYICLLYKIAYHYFKKSSSKDNVFTLFNIFVFIGKRFRWR